MHNAKVSNAPILVKILKDGSKKFRSEACPRCGGTGYLSYYGHIYNGVCFKCNGSGFFAHEWIEPSEERLEKQKLKNQIKRLESADSHNRDFMKSNGFGANGKAYMVINPNTYDIKDELKSLGAKFDYILGWKLPENNPDYPTIEININDVAKQDEFGWYAYKSVDEIREFIDAKKTEYEEAHRDPNTHVSEYLGNIGDKIVVEGKLVSRYSFETNFTYYGETTYIYRFEDINGNVVVWKSGKYLNMNDGDECTIVGTIKELKEYKGIKETVLTWCKVK